MTGFLRLAILSLCLLPVWARSTHIIGGEIGYTHISGLTYEVTLTIYGDCAGAAFPGLVNATPRVEIYKDGAPFFYIDLLLTGPGVEVTPVCPAEAGNTSCVSATGSLPGIMRYIYKNTITLDGPALKWSFLFNSQMGSNAGAGRTNAITNIISNSRMALEATLNNTVGPNNSALFSTIPTPFFCLNIPQAYNQGAVDPNGDQLSFSLVPGLDVDASGNVNSVGYVNPYTYNNPLAAVPGTFMFNAASGQMNFTPNLVQTSLVVNKVTEYRGGIEVGSCMREMNLVVLNNCNNQSPFASIPSSPAGGFDSTRTITLCNATPNPQFVIQVSDPDMQQVDVTVNGLPTGATASITGNQTANPVVTINWNLPQPFTPGTYNFYVNCQDNGCPLSSKQTFAYTIILVQPFNPFLLQGTQATCNPGNDGLITITASSAFGAEQYALDGLNFQTSTQFTGLNAGIYTVWATDARGCTHTGTVEITSPALPQLQVILSPESCEPGQDGSITLIASSINGPITGYSINGGVLQPSAVFSNLSAGNYTVMAEDSLGCRKSELLVLPQAAKPVISSLGVQDITCYGLQNGIIQVQLAVPMPANYILLPGGIVNQSGLFENLAQQSYTVYIVSAQGCRDTGMTAIVEPPELKITSLDTLQATCDRNNAGLSVETNFPPPLVYTLRPATVINTDGVFSDIAPGNYTLIVRDTNFCEVDTIVTLESAPNYFRTSTSQKNLDCIGLGLEGEATVIATGGREPYTYIWDTSPVSTTATIQSLYYGWYQVLVTDAIGCQLRDTVYISPGPCCEEVFIPNAFSPNGDGVNDQWRILTNTGMQIEQFAIFNRWGERVWQSRDQRDIWNGYYKGQPVETGTFFYLLRYTCLEDGRFYTRKGDIQVIR